MTRYLDDLFSLDGLVAVVTGGNSGIGAAIGGALARAGAAVVLVARDAGRLAAVATALVDEGTGSRVAWVSADLSSRHEVRRAADKAAAPFGDPDILVNAAGVNLRPPLAALSDEDWDRTMAVNLAAPFVLGQEYAPFMVEQGWGRIINVASQQAVRAFGNSGAYGASKAGLAGLTRSQAEAWSRDGVCCNTIVPGFVRTPMTEPLFAAEPARVAAMEARTMIGRNGTPSDFCGVAVFLASRASNYVTGQLVFVDGGFSAG